MKQKFKKILKAILDFIARLFGGIDIDKIIIPGHYKRPGAEKLKRKKQFFIENGYFESNIIIDENNKLIDGFTTYFIAKVYEFKYINVTRVKLKNK